MAVTIALIVMQIAVGCGWICILNVLTVLALKILDRELPSACPFNLQIMLKNITFAACCNLIMSSALWSSTSPMQAGEKDHIQVQDRI